ncbi:MAG: hypothetical protein K8R60_07595 [Burkholderiales bacterium]|nr:hypothetical protein [Burkholderiales bacterium]
MLAKTLTQPDGAPLEKFAGYGQIGMLQGGWTGFILFWHSLHSVLYPILLSRWMFPAAADRRWFASGRARWLLPVLIVILIGLASLYFLNPTRSDAGIFLLYLAATSGLVGVALGFCKVRETAPAPPPARPALKPALLGGCMLLFYVFQFWSPGHIPFALFLAASAVAIGVSLASMVRATWRALPEGLLFGLGDYLSFALFSALLCVASGRNPLQAVAAGAIFLALFLFLIRAVRRQPGGRSDS